MSLKLKHKMWVVVADGERALFLENEGDALYPNLQVVREMEQENPPSREQGTDQRGRHSDGPNQASSSFSETDWQRLGKERFADEIAIRLYKSAHRGDFDELAIVAPPMVLGEMRKKLHKEVTDRLKAEIPKTLTNHAIPDIEAILKAA